RFSADGQKIITASEDGTVRLWDTETKVSIQVFRGHTQAIASAHLSASGLHLLTGSSDGTCKVWEVKTGRELCTLIDFPNGDWAVVDPLGRFDASRNGDVDGLHWVVGNEPVALKQLKRYYYEPGLLAKCLGFNKQPLRPVEAL